MKKLKGNTVRKIHLRNFFMLLPLWLLLGPLAGVGLGIWLQSWPAFWIGLLVLPVGLSFLMTSRQIKKVNTAYVNMSSAAKKSLKRVDYFNSGEYGAIAVDAENVEISAVSADKKSSLENPMCSISIRSNMLKQSRLDMMNGRVSAA